MSRAMSKTKRIKRQTPSHKPAFTVADWFRWKLAQPDRPGWVPTFADFERDRHASG